MTSVPALLSCLNANFMAPTCTPGQTPHFILVSKTADTIFIERKCTPILRNQMHVCIAPISHKSTFPKSEIQLRKSPPCPCPCGGFKPTTRQILSPPKVLRQNSNPSLPESRNAVRLSK
jgi:hypothetical protein